MDTNNRKTHLDISFIRNNRPKEQSYILGTLLAVCVFVALLVIFIALATHVLDYGGIAKSTHERQKLVENIETAVIIDKEDILSNADELFDAMNIFAQKTGVTPYIYIYSEKETDPESLFTDLCKADNCFLVTYGTFGKVNALVSDGAEMVIDNEAYTIFCDYINYYKNISDDYSEVLKFAYRKTAHRIMAKTNIFNCVSAEYYIALVLIAITECFFAYKIINKIKEKHNKDNAQGDSYGKLQ